MQQVKVFCRSIANDGLSVANSLQELESEINRWLSSLRTGPIHERSVMTLNYGAAVAITVWYDDGHSPSGPTSFLSDTSANPSPSVDPASTAR